MPRYCVRLLLVALVALAAIFTPLASTYAVEECCGNCDEQRAAQSVLCSDCIVCGTGLCCLLPADPFVVGSPSVIGRLPWPARTGQSRNDPPLLPPPRFLGHPQPFR